MLFTESFARIAKIRGRGIVRVDLVAGVVKTSGVWIMAIRNCVEVVLLLTMMTVVSFVHLVVL